MNEYIGLVMLASFGAVMVGAASVLRAAIRIRAAKSRQHETQERFDFSDTLPRANHG